MDIRGKKVFILGAARSGIASALLAKSKGAYVFVSDLKSEQDIKDSVNILRENKIDFETSKNSFERIKEFDMLILSPGVHIDDNFKSELRYKNIQVLSELEFAYRFVDIPVIAITGTNGKSTTTALLGYILNNGGVKAFVGGNIGNALSNIVLDKNVYDVAVVEVSSFMLEDIETFKPYIVIFTNLSADHLDRYKDYRDYINAKLNIFKNLIYDNESRVVLNYDCKELLDVTERFSFKRVLFSRVKDDLDVCAIKDKSGWLIKSSLYNKKVSLIFNNPNLVGLHNVENVLAASAGALLLGEDPKKIEEGINTFSGLEHRIEFVREINGVKFYNDSKATNIESAMVALNSFDGRIIWIAGGRHKGTPYTFLSEIVRERVKKIIGIGEASSIIAKDLSGLVEIEECGTDFEYAVRRAFETAVPGDVVLLSPACSSYDMFTNYEERGKRFKEIIERIGK